MLFLIPSIPENHGLSFHYQRSCSVTKQKWSQYKSIYEWSDHLRKLVPTPTLFLLKPISTWTTMAHKVEKQRVADSCCFSSLTLISQEDYISQTPWQVGGAMCHFQGAQKISCESSTRPHEEVEMVYRTAVHWEYTLGQRPRLRNRPPDIKPLRMQGNSSTPVK